MSYSICIPCQDKGAEQDSVHSSEPAQTFDKGPASPLGQLAGSTNVIFWLLLLLFVFLM